MSEPDLESWRAEVREWLASVLPRRSERPEGPADYAVFQNITEEAERELLDKVRAYRKQRFDAGYGAIALPAELGGAGLSMRYVVAFTEEEQAFEPPQSTELISVTTAGSWVRPSRRSAPRNSGRSTPGPSCARTCCAASCSASRAPARTWPRWRPARFAWRTGRRAGHG